MWLLVALDVAASVLLTGFGLWHVHLARRNRTSLGGGIDGEAAYDVGTAANLRQIFGTRIYLWPLPVWLEDGPTVDGLTWPTNGLPVVPRTVETLE